MRALISLVIAVPIILSARSVWACDHDDDDDSDDEDVAEAPEPPDPPEAPDGWIASTVFAQQPDVDIDIHFDIDVRWNDHGDDDRAAASQLVRDRIEELQQRLDDATSSLGDSDDDDDD